MRIAAWWLICAAMLGAHLVKTGGHAHLPGVVWLAMMAYSTAYRMRWTSGSRGPAVHVHTDAMDRVLRAAVTVAMLILAALWMTTDWLGIGDYRPPLFAPAAGSVMVGIALWLFIRSHRDLGRNWSPALETRDEHELVQHGIYARIRHPMYAAIWLWTGAQALLLPNAFAGGLALPAFAALYFTRVPKEEAMMRAAFGERYVRYCKRTGRLWPAAPAGD